MTTLYQYMVLRKHDYEVVSRFEAQKNQIEVIKKKERALSTRGSPPSSRTIMNTDTARGYPLPCLC